MTPAEAQAMTNSEYAAFVAYAVRVQRAEERAARKARRG